MTLTKEMVSALPHKPGVYIYLDETGTELYVGKAKDLRKRVSSYRYNSKRDVRVHKLVSRIADLKYIETDTEIEALIVEARLIRELRPEFNRALKDSEFYPYLEITLGEDFPRVRITRQPSDKRSRFIGPFTDVGALRTALRAVQPVFRFCTCSKDIKADDPKLRYNRPCLNYNIGLCDAPCAGRISKTEYRRKIKSLIMFFSGRKKKLIASIKKLMKQAAEELRFEEAANYRDQLKALQRLSKPSDYQKKAVSFVNIRPQDALDELAEHLQLDEPPRRIEGYDISNLGDESAVGSLVTFVNGIPFKPGYRRYRIKTLSSQDDFGMLREVLTRRLRRIASGEHEAPSLLFLSDGGQGQVNTVARAMEEVGIEKVPCVRPRKEE
ncbi:MAG: UvrB/UvrC motif-containing protein [Planctomycetota bacterium]|nr:UvrB/UvrC motif-containing protein [Planctomycetota bacterium]